MFTSSIMHVETNPFYPKNFLTIGDNTAKVNFYFWTINYNILFFCWKIIFSLKFNEVNSIKVSKNLSLFMIYKPVCFIYQYSSLVQGGLSPHSPPPPEYASARGLSLSWIRFGWVWDFLTFNSYQLKLHVYVLDPALFRYGVKIFKKAIYSLWNQVLLGSLVVAGVQLEYQVQGWPVVAGVQLEYQVQGM